MVSSPHLHLPHSADVESSASFPTRSAGARRRVVDDVIAVFCSGKEWAGVSFGFVGMP